jgi:hypothetical protein
MCGISNYIRDVPSFKQIHNDIYQANNYIHALDHNLDIKFTLSLLMKANAIHFTDTNFTQK